MLASALLRKLVVQPDGSIAGTGNLFLDGNVFANGFMDLINGDGARLPQGFQVGDSGSGSAIAGILNMDIAKIADSAEVGVVLQLDDGSGAAVTGSGVAAFRYVPSSNKIQYSKNGGPWTDLV